MGSKRPRVEIPVSAVLALLLGWVGTQSHAAAEDDHRFVESAGILGVDFVHDHFGTGEKYMHENMGSGLAVFDYDADGRLDIYLVQGASVAPGQPASPEVTNRLFRQKEDGTFEDVTAKAGVGDRGYGMGASYADYDADGDLDLYVTNFGPNVLYRNRGDGTFEDATAEAGVGCEEWSVSAGFFDAEGDGDLDLYVVNYVDFSFDNHKWCGIAQTKTRAYCHPDVYKALPDVFYRNDGTGKYTEVSRDAGMVSTADGQGLGLGFADFDGDGNQDVFVANDATMNYLYLGDGEGGFMESALLAGVGFNDSGMAESSMGVEIGDIDGDGMEDIFLTHLDQQTNTFYRNLGEGMFEDFTEQSGLAGPSLPWVGFGNVLFDHDNDGDLDLFVTNGHIIDNIELFYPERTHRQPLQFFDNQGGGKFRERSAELDFPELLVGRGAARADLDRDGDLDLVVSQNGGRALVFLNRFGAGAGRSLAVRLKGTAGNPHGWGAWLELTVAGTKQVRGSRGITGYASQGAPEIHFGLGDAELAEELTVRWPSGRTDRFADLAAGSVYTLTEGSTEVESEPFAPASP